MQRRHLLATGAAAALTSMLPSDGTAGQASAQWSDIEKNNVRIVNDFCAAWSTRDLKKVLPFLADDCVYRMTETTPPANGHAGVTERLGSWVQNSERIEFKVLETFASGPMVMNHRIDHFAAKPRPLTWEGVGIFFVKDGKIKEWSDYTIKVER